VGLYLLLFFMRPFATLALGIVGFADSWLNLRARFGAGS